LRFRKIIKISFNQLIAIRTTYIFLLLATIVSARADYLDYIFLKQNASYNSFGQIGLIQTPSAENIGESSLFVNINQNEIWKYGAITVSPFNWLEASYFYYRPKDLIWSSKGFSAAGKYLDKGFNVKFSKSFLKNSNLHFAIGLDDFAGTGLFTKEYIVGTYNLNKSIKLNLGLGWGYFNGEDNGFDNIFASVDQNFDSRPVSSSNYNLGGSPSYDLWFRGENSIFWGLEYNIPYSKGIKLKIENDPFNYNEFTCCGSGITKNSQALRAKDKSYNFGFNFPITDSFNIGLSYIKGNSLNLTFSFGGNFSKSLVKKKPISRAKKKLTINKNISSNQKLNFYENLLNNLNINEVYLQSAEINNLGNLQVAVATDKYIYPVETHKLVGQVSNEIADLLNVSINTIETIQVNAGSSLYSIKTINKYLKEDPQYPLELVSLQTKLSSTSGEEYLKNEFKPSVIFPEIFSTYSLALVNHVGDPQRFYYGGLSLNIKNEIKFSRNLILNADVSNMLFDDFNNTRNFPDSKLPHVRSDIVSYLQESSTFIPTMQLTYFKKFGSSLYSKISAGLLESMYGGYGGEFILKRFDSNFAIGAEAYSVKKRGFDRKFDFLKYEAKTGHINLYYFLNNLGILSSVSYGKYLAGDRGFTIDLSKKSQSGFTAGIFFTRTNVSAELFGEGSFDKGFYFSIPLNLFSERRRGGDYNFLLRPLTRDGGQKLDPQNKLQDIFHHTTKSELERDWINF